MKTTRHITFILAGALFAPGFLPRSGEAATISQFLFDQGTNSDLVINEGGLDQPRMQQPGVAFTNLHVAGGPFTGGPWSSIGMMQTPTRAASTWV